MVDIDFNDPVLALWNIWVYLFENVLAPGAGALASAIENFINAWVGLDNSFFITMVLIIIFSLAMAVKQTTRSRR